MTGGAPRGRHALALALVAAAGIAAYLPSAGVYFLKDDLSMAIMTDGSGRFDWDGFRDQLLWPTARTWDDIWRPVPALTWAADFLLFGPDPVAFHLGNILFHALAGAAIYWLLNRWTGFRSPPAAFLGAVLFEVWPLHPEAILWSTQRTVVLGLLLGVVSLLLFDVWLHRGGRRHLVFAWTAMALATLSREHGAALPAVMAAMALVLGPPRPARRRLGIAVRVGFTGAAILAVWFGCRWLIFGRLYGGYAGWETMEAYARDLRVAERFPETVRACLVPANVHFFGTIGGGSPSRLDLLTWLHAAAAALALFTVVRHLARDRRPLALLAVALLFAVTAWLPVRQVFWVDPSLLNARSGYHLVALLVAVVPVLVVDPFHAGPTRGWRLAAAAILVLASAAVLQANLRAYDGGGRQVRGIQEALCREADRSGRETVQAVFHVPTEFEGCPTMDAYLRWVVRPPYVRRGFDAIPFVAGLEGGWPVLASRAASLGAPGLQAVREDRRPGGSLRPVAYHVASPSPPYLRPLFGGEEAARGDAPPRLVAPEDGAIVLASAPPPVFAFRAAPGPWRGLIHLETTGGVRLSFPFETGKNADVSEDGVVRCRVTDSVPAGAPAGLAWPVVPGFPNPYPVLWRVESLDAAGVSLGVSSTSRLLILEDRPPAR